MVSLSNCGHTCIAGGLLKDAFTKKQEHDYVMLLGYQYRLEMFRGNISGKSGLFRQIIKNVILADDWFILQYIFNLADGQIIFFRQFF